MRTKSRPLGERVVIRRGIQGARRGKPASNRNAVVRHSSSFRLPPHDVHHSDGDARPHDLGAATESARCRCAVLGKRGDLGVGALRELIDSPGLPIAGMHEQSMQPVSIGHCRFPAARTSVKPFVAIACWGSPFGST